MSLLNKHFWKFFVGLLGMVALGFLVIYATNFYKYWNDQRTAQSAVEAIR